jgi:riboflavin synthase
MFNGIIYNIGTVQYINEDKSNCLIGVKTNLNFGNKDIGASVSCNGVCLTITKIKKKIIYFYISKETLNRSNLKFINIGDSLNIERSLIYGQRISGHFVQGHVDTTASIKEINILGKTWLVKFILKDKKLCKFLIEKASISINGVSLTISKVKNHFFEINIIPHSLNLTNMKNLKVRTIVNVELDIIAKYILKVSN